MEGTESTNVIPTELVALTPNCDLDRPPLPKWMTAMQPSEVVGVPVGSNGKVIRLTTVPSDHDHLPITQEDIDVVRAQIRCRELAKDEKWLEHEVRSEMAKMAKIANYVNGLIKFYFAPASELETLRKKQAELEQRLKAQESDKRKKLNEARAKIEAMRAKRNGTGTGTGTATAPANAVPTKPTKAQELNEDLVNRLYRAGIDITAVLADYRKSGKVSAGFQPTKA